MTEYIWPMEFGSYGEGAEYMSHVFDDYHNARIHSAIGYSTPGEFHMKCRKQLGPGGGYIKSKGQKVILKTGANSRLLNCQSAINPLFWSRSCKISQGERLI